MPESMSQENVVWLSDTILGPLEVWSHNFKVIIVSMGMYLSPNTFTCVGIDVEWTERYILLEFMVLWKILF